MVNYPAQIDTTQSLPTVIDNFTPVQGKIFNVLRDTVLSIENELGVKPSSTYGTVRARLDYLENIIGNLQIISLNGDLGNTLYQPYVIGLQGRPLSNASPSIEDVLTWDGIAWVPSPAQGGGGSGGAPSGPAGGNLSGIYPNPIVAKINNATVPAAGSLTTGNILQVTGSSSLSYGPLNLAGGSNYVTGILPTSNMSAINLAGGSSSVINILPATNLPSATTSALGLIELTNNLGGTATSPTVIGLTITSQVQGSVLYYNGSNWVQLSPGSNGQVLTTAGPSANPSWTTVSGGGSPTGSAGGDLGGTYPNPTVAKINTASVPAAGSLTTGNVLQVSGSSALSYGPLNLAGGANYVTGVLPATNHPSATTSALGLIELTNNLGGTATSPTVVGLTITSQVQGSVLYYNGSNWVQLSPGSSGQVLTTAGPSANPSWTTVSGGGGGSYAPNITNSPNQPAIGSTVVFDISSTAQFFTGQTVLVQSGISSIQGGIYRITAVSSNASITCVNLGTNINTAAGNAIPLGSSVTVIANPNVLTISTLNLLATLPTGSYLDGQIVFSLDVLDYFYLRLNVTSGLSGDGITVIASSTSNAYWVRTNTSNAYWRSQTTWYLSSSGNDTNNGFTSSTPLLSWDELKRRVGPVWLLTGNTTVNVLSSGINGAIDLDIDCYNNGSSYTFTLTASGIASAATGTIASVVNANLSSNQIMTVTLTTSTGAFTSGSIISDTSNSGATFILTTGSSPTFNCIPHLNSLGIIGSGTFPPSAGDSIQQLTLPSVNVKKLNIRNVSGGGSPTSFIYGLNFVSVTNRNETPEISGAFLQACSLGNLQTIGCNFQSCILACNVKDYQYESSSTGNLLAGQCYFIAGSSISCRNGLYVDVIPGTLINCSIGSLTLVQGSYVNFKSCQLEGMILAKEHSRIVIANTNGLYGSASGIGITFYPYSSMWVGNGSSTITSANSLSVAGTTTTPTWYSSLIGGNSGSLSTLNGIYSGSFSGQAFAPNYYISISN